MTEFVYLSQEDVVAAGGTDMAAMIGVLERAFRVKARGEVRMPPKVMITWADEPGTEGEAHIPAFALDRTLPGGIRHIAIDGTAAQIHAERRARGLAARPALAVRAETHPVDIRRNDAVELHAPAGKGQYAGLIREGADKLDRCRLFLRLGCGVERSLFGLGVGFRLGVSLLLRRWRQGSMFGGGRLPVDLIGRYPVIGQRIGFCLLGGSRRRRGGRRLVRRGRLWRLGRGDVFVPGHICRRRRRLLRFRRHVVQACGVGRNLIFL